VQADSRVDAYIGTLPEWQQAICQQVREIAHAADPEVEETIKRAVRPYFVLQGNICALLATKDHVNVFIYDPTVADPHGIINQGHGNATAKAVQIYRGDAVNRAALLEMFRAVVANNRAGGWRRLQALAPRRPPRPVGVVTRPASPAGTRCGRRARVARAAAGRWPAGRAAAPAPGRRAGRSQSRRGR
jgi:hypothetical protein